MYSYTRNEVTTHDEYKRHQQTGEGRHTWTGLGQTRRAVTSKLSASTAHCMLLLPLNVGNIHGEIPKFNFTGWTHNVIMNILYVPGIQYLRKREQKFQDIEIFIELTLQSDDLRQIFLDRFTSRMEL